MSLLYVRCKGIEFRIIVGWLYNTITRVDGQLSSMYSGMHNMHCCSDVLIQEADKQSFK